MNKSTRLYLTITLMLGLLLSTSCSALPLTLQSYDVTIYPGQLGVYDSWFISLSGGGWKNGTLELELTISNNGPRRNFGYVGISPGPQLVTIDSTGKLVEPEGNPFSLWYAREFYPNEIYSGSLKFQMSPYSGKTGLYITKYYHARRYLLFDVEQPKPIK